jgi:glycosyltransferase involved in cell wall biosynthesis
MFKKILFVSISAPPKNAPESLQVAKYLKYLAEANQVTLVTSKISGGWRPKDAGLEKHLKNINKLIEVPVWDNRLQHFIYKKFLPDKLSKPDEDAPFHWKFNQVRKQLNGYVPDIIYSRSTPLSSHFLAYKLFLLYKKPWILHLSDPWVDNPYNKFTEKELVFHAYWEKEFFQAAAKITLTSQKTLSFYRNKYPEFINKFELSPNVYDPEEVVDVPFQFRQKLTFVHTGRLYGSRSCIPLIKAIELLVKSRPDADKNIEFLFAGFCDEANLKALEGNKLNCIKYLGPVSFSEALDLQRKANMLVMIDGNEENELMGLFFPSKMLDYAIAGRKIIAITTAGSTTEEIITGKYGACFRHHDITGLASFLDNTYTHFLQNDAVFFKPGPVPAEYSAKTVVENLNQLISRTI